MEPTKACFFFSCAANPTLSLDRSRPRFVLALSFFLQPQDYELAVTALNNGSMFTASYMQNMLLPMGGVMHRVSMGVQAMLIGWSSAPRPNGCT
jgi:hypothetical protein